MSGITGKLNLTALVSVVTSRKGKDGNMVEGVFIPIDKNHLFKSDKGNVYMDITAFEIKEKKYDDTHLVKLSIPKKIYDAMSDEEKKSQPILGNLKVWDGAGGQETEVEHLGPDDDLPF